MNEAYLRLVGGDPNRLWDGRGHFVTAAVEVMRRILIEATRARDDRNGRRAPPNRPRRYARPRCTQLETLVANSIRCLRGRLQRGESGAAGPGQRRPRPPLTEPHHVDRRRCQEVLKVRLRLSDIATLSQPTTSDRKIICTYNASSRYVPRPELLGSLLAAACLQRLVLLTGQ